MTDETGGKPLMGYIAYTNHGPEWVTLTMGQLMAVDATNPKRPVPSLTIPVTDFTELIAAATECAEAMDAATKRKFQNMVPYPGKMGDETRELAPVRRLRAAVARVRGGVMNDLPPLKYHHHMRQITRCQADSDDDCEYAACPQKRDNEPYATGRHCPWDRAECEP